MSILPLPAASPCAPCRAAPPPGVAVPRGAEVAVRGRIANADGQWRFVEYRGLAGRIPADNLVEP